MCICTNAIAISLHVFFFVNKILSEVMNIWKSYNYVNLVEHCTGIAGVKGSNPVQAWIFCRLSLRNCVSCVYNCDDHLSFKNLIYFNYSIDSPFPEGFRYPEPLLGQFCFIICFVSLHLSWNVYFIRFANYWQGHRNSITPIAAGP